MPRPGLAALAVLLATPAAAQEFADAQRFTSRVLYAREDAAAAQRQAERRRVDELDRRAQQQAVLLQQQAQSVRQLDGELRLLRDERRLIELADAFDAALAGERWQSARALLAGAVVLDLGGAPVATLPADDLVAQLARVVGRGGLLPRFNQRVSFDGDGAAVTADGYTWGAAGRSREALDRRFGRYEYRFGRTADGWKIAGIAFRPAAPL